MAGSTQEPCLCRSWHSVASCTGCCCRAASRHHLLQLFFLPFLCSLERNQGDGLNKSHSQPTKPPPCSPGKCSLQTRGLCRDMAVGPEQTSERDQSWERAVLSQGRDKGMAPCLSCWRMKGPVLCLHRCKRADFGPVWMYLPNVYIGMWAWDARAAVVHVCGVW